MPGKRRPLLTTTMSFRSFALYAARALARANCVCLGVRSWAGSKREGSTDEKQIILDQVALEGLHWQAPVAHGQNKWMLDVAIPDSSHVGSLEKILDEAVAGETKRVCQHGRQAGEAKEYCLGILTEQKADCTSSGSGSTARCRDPGPAPFGCQPQCICTLPCRLLEHPALW